EVARIATIWMRVCIRLFVFSSRRRHTRFDCDWSSDVCSSDLLKHAGLMAPLEQLGFNLVGYGCTTCIGNSGPLPEAVSAEIRDEELVVASVLSGNRNFEGRVQQEIGRASCRGRGGLRGVGGGV